MNAHNNYYAPLIIILIVTSLTLHVLIDAYSADAVIDIEPNACFEYTPRFNQEDVVLTISYQDGDWFTIIDESTLYGTIGPTPSEYTVVLQATSSNPTQTATQIVVFNVLGTSGTTACSVGGSSSGTCERRAISSTARSDKPAICNPSASDLPTGLILGTNTESRASPLSEFSSCYTDDHRNWSGYTKINRTDETVCGDNRLSAGTSGISWGRGLGDVACLEWEAVIARSVFLCSAQCTSSMVPVKISHLEFTTVPTADMALHSAG